MTLGLKDSPPLTDRERQHFTLLAALVSPFLAGLWFYLTAGSDERAKVKKYVGLQFIVLGIVWLFVFLATVPAFFWIVYYVAMKNTGLSPVHLNPIVFIWFFGGAALTTFITIFFLWYLKDVLKTGTCSMPLISNLVGRVI